MFTRLTLVIAFMALAVSSAWSVGALFVRPLRSSQNYNLITGSRCNNARGAALQKRAQPKGEGHIHIPTAGWRHDC